jgi:pyruvate formate lyase activating enzyme
MKTMIECNICPIKCHLRDGQIGACGIITNDADSLSHVKQNIISAVNVEPIEKKPLYHFMPGSQTLSVGFYGCNMSCQYCQNSTVSHVRVNDVDPAATWNPDKLVQEARDRDVPIICFTYTEPFMYLDYVRETYQKARAHGIKIVVSTNGYFQAAHWNEALNYVDAINLDIKTPNIFDPSCNVTEFDKKVLRIDEKYYEAIRRNLKAVVALGKHVECSMLVTSMSYQSAIGRYATEHAPKEIAKISKDIPVHLLKYFPVSKLDMKSTSDDLMEEVYDSFSKELNFVYTDFGHKDKPTLCSKCKSPLILRQSYAIEWQGQAIKGLCECGARVPFVMEVIK